MDYEGFLWSANRRRPVETPPVGEAKVNMWVKGEAIEKPLLIDIINPMIIEYDKFNFYQDQIPSKE